MGKDRDARRVRTPLPQATEAEMGLAPINDFDWLLIQASGADGLKREGFRRLPLADIAVRPFDNDAGRGLVIIKAHVVHMHGAWTVRPIRARTSDLPQFFAALYDAPHRAWWSGEKWDAYEPNIIPSSEWPDDIATLKVDFSKAPRLAKILRSSVRHGPLRAKRNKSSRRRPKSR